MQRSRSTSEGDRSPGTDHSRMSIDVFRADHTLHVLNRPPVFMDGREYFNSLGRDIESLEQGDFIGIMGWEMTPSIELLPEQSLIDLLERARLRNVTVRILIWSNLVHAAESIVPFRTPKTPSTKTDAARTALVSRKFEAGVHFRFLPGFGTGPDSTHHQKHVTIVKSGRIHSYLGGIDLARGRFEDTIKVVFARELELFSKVREYSTHLRNCYSPKLLTWEQWSLSNMPRTPWLDVQVRIDWKPATEVFKTFMIYWLTVHQELACPEMVKEDTDLFNGVLDQLHVADAMPASPTCYCQFSGFQQGCFDIFQKYHFVEIQEAWIRAIDAAQESIYIEQQFFQGRVGDEGPLENEIPKAVVRAIVQNNRAGRHLRVTIVMPLAPEGPASDSNEISLFQFETFQRMRTELRSINLLFDQFIEVVYLSGDTSKCSPLDSSKPFPDIPIYVHSKLLIVDDFIMVTGSANVNDRSMTGTVDTEIAVTIVDTEPNEDANSIHCFKRKRIKEWESKSRPHPIASGSASVTLACDLFTARCGHRDHGVMGRKTTIFH